MSASSKPAHVIRGLLVEFVYLVLLWMLFVSMTKRAELYAGLAAALIGAVADWVVKAQDFAKFRPRWSQLALIWTEPWYALTGTAATLRALARKLLGKPSEAQFRVVKIDAGRDDAESAARRALMVAYMTMTPSSIVIGIDQAKHRMLIHQMSPTGTPVIAKKLGARE